MDFLKQAVKTQLARARLSPLEQKVFDATNADAWGPHGTVLGEIARCTTSADERAQVLNMLLRRVAEDSPDQWRCVYKALTVLDYLVANGSEAVVEELCNSSRRLAGLSGFQYKDTDGNDQARFVHARPGRASLAPSRRESSRGALTLELPSPAGDQRSAQKRHAHGGMSLVRLRSAARTR